jgi:hypothetical protein
MRKVRQEENCIFFFSELQANEGSLASKGQVHTRITQHTCKLRNKPNAYDEVVLLFCSPGI